MARPLPTRGRRERRRLLAALRGGLIKTGLFVGVLGAVLLGGLDQWAAPRPAEIARVAAPAAIAPRALAWDVDLDGDGVPDLANPTRSGIRNVDAYGSGHFGAERDGGRRIHEGADFIAAAGAAIRAPVSGVVTKMGFAYGRDTRLRFVELTDAPLHLVARVFYVDPSVALGQAVKAGMAIGAAENLAVRYPRGITNHVHVEITDGRGFFFDPSKILPPASRAPIFAALKLDPLLAKTVPG